MLLLEPLMVMSGSKEDHISEKATLLLEVKYNQYWIFEGNATVDIWVFRNLNILAIWYNLNIFTKDGY